MDWNTFFATLSQSAAGLIAIIAAFVISKLLGENEKQETFDSQISKLIIEYNDILQRLSVRKFEWYNRLNIEYSSEIEEAVKSGRFKDVEDNEKLELLYLIEPHLYRSEECLNELNKIIKKFNVTGNGFGMMPSLMQIAPRGLWDKINGERELINQLQIDCYTLINKFKDVKSDFMTTKNGLNSFKYTLYILAFGFFITVIYPLHFMPMEIGSEPEFGVNFGSIFNLIFSVKGFFLSLLSLVVIMIFGYFVLVIHRIRKKYKDLERELGGSYFEIKTYCKYFQ